MNNLARTFLICKWRVHNTDFLFVRRPMATVEYYTEFTFMTPTDRNGMTFTWCLKFLRLVSTQAQYYDWYKLDNRVQLPWLNSTFYPCCCRSQKGCLQTDEYNVLFIRWCRVWNVKQKDDSLPFSAGSRAHRTLSLPTVRLHFVVCKRGGGTCLCQGVLYEGTEINLMDWGWRCADATAGILFSVCSCSSFYTCQLVQNLLSLAKFST